MESVLAVCRFAEHGVGKVVQQFAEEMWKRGGIRMVVLTGWKDEKKGMFSTRLVKELQSAVLFLNLASFDFNHEIQDGPSFQGFRAVQGQWDQYIRQAFMEEGGEFGPDEVEDSGPVEQRSKQLRKPRSNAAVERVTQSDGTIWIPDLAQYDRSDLQDLIRGYLTAHYSRLVPTGPSRLHR